MSRAFQLAVYSVAPFAIILGAVALPVTGVVAQQNVIEQCLATEGQQGRDGTVCIGRLSDPCSPGHGEVECIEREHNIWDQMLNKEYQAMLALLDEEQKGKLKDAELTWIKLRDRDCELAWHFFKGTMAIPMIAYCKMKRTGQRALWLRQWQESLGG